MPGAQSGLESHIERLSLQVNKETPASSNTKAHSRPVAESWEEELEGLSWDEDDENEELQCRGDQPNAPPPTPSSPTTRFSYKWDDATVIDHKVGRKRGEDHSKMSARPEKQTAVAGRMIASALGVRAPKKTEEQRAYEKAVKEKEIKRRNQQREDQSKAKEDAERARTAVWED
ncbi:MAG: hypothetical protein M1835_007863 [Candelina submexicana]|nr:MAG: hypothetical protein M1835_007863 [Candelina submexicana]